MYGSGLRLMESLRLRYKDIDLESAIILVRDGKGAKDRVTVLPESLREPLRRQLDLVRERLERPFTRVCRSRVAFALERKFREATWTLPGSTSSLPRNPSRPALGVWRRHHITRKACNDG